jgi:hypothetical protein
MDVTDAQASAPPLTPKGDIRPAAASASLPAVAPTPPQENGRPAASNQAAEPKPTGPSIAHSSTRPLAHSSTPPRLKADAPRTVHITFRRSASLDADRKRLAEIVDVLSKYEGQDRFEIVVEANGSARWQLDFPNNRTRVCSKLEAELAQRLRPGGWKVE